MNGYGALKSCSVVEFGGMTGGEYEAVVEKDENGKIVASLFKRETAGSRAIKKKKKIKPEIFEKLEAALSEYDFSKKASPETVRARREMTALDAPVRHVNIRYENEMFDLNADDAAEENISAGRILTGFFVSAFDD